MLLPHSLGTLPGSIGERPEDFVVREDPAYEISDSGEHWYVEVTKRDLTTPFLVEQVQRHYRVRDVGFAGMKDRHGVTTQRISLPAACRDEPAPQFEGLLEWKPLGLHANKLKRGHLKGNFFEIRVDCSVPLEAHVEWLREQGFANYFGAQRFGREEDNPEQGQAILDGTWRGPHWKKSILLSAWQSWRFNAYLEERIRRGLFFSVLDGDFCQRLDTGGMFVVEEAGVEQARYRDLEISPTGPLPGFKLRAAKREAAELEQRFLSDHPGLRREKLSGARRAIRLPLRDLEWSDGRFRFWLPAGSYATTVLAHIFGPA